MDEKDNILLPSKPATIHYSELRKAEPGEPFFEEWNTYLSEVGRLLSEGHEGKFALLKGASIVGVFDQENDALKEGNRLFFRQPFLVHQIREREPLLRIRGYNLPCPSSPIQLRKPA